MILVLASLKEARAGLPPHPEMHLLGLKVAAVAVASSSRRLALAMALPGRGVTAKLEQGHRARDLYTITCAPHHITHYHDAPVSIN